MAAAVDEERRRPRHLAGVGIGDVLGDAPRVHAAAQLVAKARHVEPELLGVADEVLDVERVLVGEQQVVHLPEAALRRGRLRGLGGQLGVRVHVGERQVAEHEAHVLAEVVEQLAHDRLGLPAVRALEVAVLDERDRRVVGAADVVALRVDGRGQVDDVLGAADELARTAGARTASAGR